MTASVSAGGQIDIRNHSIALWKTESLCSSEGRAAIGSTFTAPCANANPNSHAVNPASMFSNSNTDNLRSSRVWQSSKPMPWRWLFSKQGGPLAHRSGNRMPCVVRCYAFRFVDGQQCVGVMMVGQGLTLR
ncbi:hypothetical protein GCM10023307_08620 [Lysobacter hankyongensis]|uniref:DUF3011 domain-containing protein n=1 Tax=Lysobacter hankyongensis TaxID=1176535 RepID=A0ABP9AVZ6_9GAMM